MVTCIHLENCSGMGWHSASQKWEQHSLGAIPSFAAEVAAVKEGADCPGVSKKLWMSKERISVLLQPLGATEEALLTWYWHMNPYSGCVSELLTTGPVWWYRLGCVAHWPLSHRAAHGPFCALEQAWLSRTCQPLISVGPQEQNQSTFGAFSRLWFLVYVVYMSVYAHVVRSYQLGLTCLQPWPWAALHLQRTESKGWGASISELSPSPWCWQSTGGNECHWVINSPQRPLGRWRSHTKGLEQHYRDTPVAEWALPQCRVLTPAGCCWVLPRL